MFQSWPKAGVAGRRQLAAREQILFGPQIRSKLQNIPTIVLILIRFIINYKNI